MARINLLPWRAERQKERKKQFMLMLLMSAVAGLALWFLVNSYYNQQISGQMERNAFLNQKIEEVKAQIAEIEKLEEKKKKLLNRKKVIEELQANRSQMVHLFDSLVRTIPDGVILTSIKQEGEKLTLEGRSQSHARVSTYMEVLSASGWMSKPELSIIQSEGENKGLPYTFSLAVTLVNPNAKKEGEEGAVPADATAGAVTTEQLQTLSPATPAAPAAGAATPAPAAGTPAPANSQQPATPAAPAAPTGGAKS
ncbi:MAG: PilN domain-containing protein [Xanthomonadaceae bacterium]|nr:PilN domain-containing protein [Xanthomonadaceae bacterium]